MHWKIGGWTATSLALAALLISGFTYHAWGSFLLTWPIPAPVRVMMWIVTSPWIFLVPLAGALACGAVTCFRHAAGRKAGTLLITYISLVVVITAINMVLNAYLMQLRPFRDDDVFINASDIGLAIVSLGILLIGGLFPLVLVGIIRKVSAKADAATGGFEVLPPSNGRANDF